MEKIVSYITKNLISVIGIAILTGTTLTTSALGVMKVANNFEKTKIEVPEVKEIEPIATTTNSPTPTGGITNQSSRASSISHPIGSVRTTTTGIVIIPTTIPVTNNTSTPQTSASSNGCIITLSGQQYDVARLRSTHSGGDIFNCGTDMTSVYQGRHGTNMSRMQQYLVQAGGTTSNNSNSNTNTGGSAGGNSGSSSNSSNTPGASNSSNSGTQSSGTSTTSTPSEIHKEEEHREDQETHDEDHKEEEKTHTESFLQRLLQLVIS